jgi:hypothetical protein
MLGFSLQALVALLAAAPLTTLAPVSDRVGIYAVVERVEFIPDTANAMTIQIWGVFALAKMFDTDGVSYLAPEFNAYNSPERGYLLFTMIGTNEVAARAEWADLKSLAGKGVVIGFGSRGKGPGRVRPASEPRGKPDVYPMGVGIVHTPSTNSGPRVEHELLRFPAVVSPETGARVRPGSVRLVARNVADTSVRYVFQIEGDASGKETSPPLRPGRGETAWTPPFVLRDGERYEWRVWVVKDAWKGPVAVSVITAGR